MIFFVSNDYDFVDHLATRIIELTPEGVHSYQGNYESFLDQKEASQLLRAGTMQDGVGLFGNIQSSSTSQAGITSGESRLSFEAKKAKQALERKIEKCEAEIEKIQCSFADLEYGTPEFSQAQKLLAERQKERDQLYEQLQKIEA